MKQLTITSLVVICFVFVSYTSAATTTSTASTTISVGSCIGTPSPISPTVTRIKWTLGGVSGPGTFSYQWSGSPLPALRTTTIPETEIDYINRFFFEGKTSVIGPTVKVISSGTPSQSLSVSCLYNISAVSTNGSCGVTNSTCSTGTLNDINDSATNYLWNCNGSNGGTNASCSLPLPVNGICGTIQNTCDVGTVLLANKPWWSQLLASVLSVFAISTDSSWKCSGLNGGNTVTCTVPKVLINGQCGTANNICTAGTLDDKPDSSKEYLWNCNGVNGGKNAYCSVSSAVSATCGTAKDTCVNGKFESLISPYTSTSYNWICDDLTGLKFVSCQVPIPPTDGVCGSANNVCTTGTLNNIADTNLAWLWNCNGINGGATTSCSLPKPQKIDGVCGTTNNLCTAGTLNDTQDSNTNYAWNCAGINGGRKVSCHAPKTPIDAVCGEKTGTCSVGKLKSLRVSTSTASWICSSLNGGAEANCKPAVSNGVCGTVKNTCTIGTPSDIVNSSENYGWNCNGANGGNNTSCSLPIPPVPLQAPSNLAASVSSDCAGTINLNWNISPGALGYSIYRRDGYVAASSYSIVGTSTSNTYTDDVGELGKYIYKVTSASGSKESGFSSEVTVDSDITCPAISSTATDFDYINASLDPITNNSIGLLIDGIPYSPSKTYGIGKWRSFTLLLPSSLLSSTNPVVDAVLFGDEGLYVEQEAPPISYTYTNVLDYEVVGKHLVRYLVMLDSGELVASPAFYLNFDSANGVCGATSYSCVSGEVNSNMYNGSPISATDTWWAWTCMGIGRGTDISCSIKKPFANGSCGTTNNTCKTGEPNRYSDPADTTTNYLWTCNGTTGGTSASCSLKK